MKIESNNHVLIIAEAGVNHNGDLNLAKELIEVAIDAKVDAVKFQAWKAEKIASRYAAKAEYQLETTHPGESQVDMLKKIEISDQDHRELCAYTESRGIKYLCSPFDFESIDLLEKMGMMTFKIPSGEMTNLPYLRKIGNLNKKIILSTGMSDLGEIEDALEILVSSGTEVGKISILHCNTEYPTPFIDVNLRAIETLTTAFPEVKVGYSDHTIGIEVAIAAVSMGAKIIEKHFTLDRKMEGPDHKASLEPAELKSMVSAIRNIEKAFGSGVKRPSLSEKKNIVIARKSIVAATKIKKGERFNEANLTVKRPGTGISPMNWDKVIGKKADKDYAPDDLIESNSI